MPYIRLVLTSACEFGQDKLLGQTKCNMDTHVSSETFEYKSSTTVRIWVIGIGNRS